MGVEAIIYLPFVAYTDIKCPSVCLGLFVSTSVSSFILTPLFELKDVMDGLYVFVSLFLG